MGDGRHGKAAPGGGQEAVDQQTRETGLGDDLC